MLFVARTLYRHLALFYVAPILGKSNTKVLLEFSFLLGIISSHDYRNNIREVRLESRAFAEASQIFSPTFYLLDREVQHPHSQKRSFHCLITSTPAV